MRQLGWVIVGAALLALGGCAGKQKKADPLATTQTVAKRVSFTGSRIPRELQKERHRAPGASAVQVMGSKDSAGRIAIVSGANP